MKQNGKANGKKVSRHPVETGKKGASAKPPAQPKLSNEPVIQRVIKNVSPHILSSVQNQIGEAINKLKAILVNQGNERARAKVIAAAKLYLGYSTSRQMDSYVYPAIQQMLQYFSSIHPIVQQDTTVDAYAYVYKGNLNHIYLGKQFKDAGYSGKDSIAGVILHEVSHLILDTEDHAYGDKGVDKLVKQENKAQARNNADNWERFFEALLW